MKVSVAITHECVMKALNIVAMLKERLDLVSLCSENEAILGNICRDNKGAIGSAAAREQFISQSASPASWFHLYAVVLGASGGYESSAFCPGDDTHSLYFTASFSMDAELCNDSLWINVVEGVAQALVPQSSVYPGVKKQTSSFKFLWCDGERLWLSQVFPLIMIIWNGVRSLLPQARGSDWCYWLWSGSSEEDAFKLFTSVTDRPSEEESRFDEPTLRISCLFLFLFSFLPLVCPFTSLWDRPVTGRTIECCQGVSEAPRLAPLCSASTGDCSFGSGWC